MDDDESFMAVSTGMMGLTNTMQQSLMAFLNRRLNFQVAAVEVWRVHPTYELAVGVKFKNGRIVKTTADEARSEAFLATCVMVYDLPPK